MENAIPPQPEKGAFKASLEYGLYVGLALVILSLAFVLMGQFDSKVHSWIQMALMLAGMVYFITNYRDQYNHGMLTYVKGLEVGTYIALISGFILFIYHLFLYKFIDPSLLDEVRRQTEEELSKRQDLSDKQIKQSMKFMNIFLSPVGLSLASFFGTFILQFIMALIVPIFLKRQPDA